MGGGSLAQCFGQVVHVYVCMLWGGGGDGGFFAV